MGLKNSLNLPFLGALSYCDFHNKSIDEQKRILIKLEIYENNNYVQFFVFKNLNTFDRLFDISANGVDFFSVENKYSYSRFIKYFDIDFVLNTCFVEDVYLNMKFDVDCDTEEKIELEKPRVLWEVSKYLNTAEKLSFLEKRYNFHFTEIRSVNNYLCFFNPEAFGFDDWQQFIFSQIYNEPKLVEFHLFNTANYDTTFLDVSKDWIKLKFHSEMMDFVKNEIDNLKIDKATSTASKFSVASEVNTDLIFNDDGKEIFQFITEKYKGKKNKAFFSDLYFFLSKNKKLLIPRSSKDQPYCNYVMSIFPELKPFNKLTVTDTDVYSGAAQSKRMKDFSSIYKTYSRE